MYVCFRRIDVTLTIVGLNVKSQYCFTDLSRLSFCQWKEIYNVFFFQLIEIYQCRVKHTFIEALK